MRRPNQLLLSALILQIVAPSAQAASYTVNLNGDPISGIAMNCAAGNASTCTLRDAIAKAANGDVIDFSTDLTIALVSGQTLTLSKDVTIDGNGHKVVVSGNGAATVITVGSGVAATINHITIQDGYNAIRGGGISNHGTVTLSNSNISNNNSAYGGGIYNYGAISLLNTTLTHNHAAGCGAGICNGYSGTATLTNSTLAGNSGYWGGAIGNIFGTVTLINSTLSANSSASGGGIRNWGGNLTLTNSTLVANSARLEGAGVDNQGTATFANAIVADGCYGTKPIDNGGNLDSGTSCGFDASASLNNATLNLGPLQDNGGATQTRLPNLGSAALDAGIDSVCTAVPVNAVDQRGVSRPQGAHCDSGAVERQAFEDNIFNAGFDL